MKYFPAFVTNEPKMIPLRSRISLILLGLVVLAGIGAAIYLTWLENHPMDVNELWRVTPRYSLEGETRTVRGIVVFDPTSDFQFNGVYLIDTETPDDFHSPVYGFWFGIRVDGVTCSTDTTKTAISCEPFGLIGGDPVELQGTIHLQQIGKKDIMWLTDVNFEHPSK